LDIFARDRHAADQFHGGSQVYANGRPAAAYAASAHDSPQAASSPARDLISGLDKSGASSGPRALINLNAGIRVREKSAQVVDLEADGAEK